MSKSLKAALPVAAIILPLVGAPTLALGIDSRTVDHLSHIVDCVGWLINDPAKHASFCLSSPSNVTQDQLDDMFKTDANAAPQSSSSSSSGPP